MGQEIIRLKLLAQKNKNARDRGRFEWMLNRAGADAAKDQSDTTFAALITLAYFTASRLK